MHLTIVYIRSLYLSSYIFATLYPFTYISFLCVPCPSHMLLLFCPLSLYTWKFLLCCSDYTYKWDYEIFFFVYLAVFTSIFNHTMTHYSALTTMGSYQNLIILTIADQQRNVISENTSSSGFVLFYYDCFDCLDLLFVCAFLWF